MGNMSLEELKKYVGIVCQLETNVYIQQKYTDLFLAESEEGRKIAHDTNIEMDKEQSAPDYSEYSKLYYGSPFFNKVLTPLGDFLSGFIVRAVTVLLPDVALLLILYLVNKHNGGNINIWKIFWIVLLVAGILGGVVTAYLGKKTDAKNKEKHKDRHRIEVERELQLRKMTLRKDIFADEAEREKQEMEKTSGILTRAYSQGIIDKKYRNLVAVCSIFDYLGEGRCDGLESAYALYESELEQGLIKTELGDVQSHQHKLYETVKNVTEDINSLSDELRKAVWRTIWKADHDEYKQYCNDKAALHRSAIEQSNSECLAYLESVK